MFGTKRWDCHPWVTSFSAFAGLAVYLALYFAEADEKVPMSPGLLGILMNLTMMVLLEGARRLYVIMTSKKSTTSEEHDQSDEEGLPVKDKESAEPWTDISVPAWDQPNVSKFGKDRLTSDFIWKAMENIREPVTEPWFVILVLAFSVLSTPITAGSLPAIGSDGLLVSDPGAVFGIPAWAARIIVSMIPTTLFLLYAISCIPNNLFPENESEDDSEDWEEDERENVKKVGTEKESTIGTEKLDRSMTTHDSSFSTINDDVAVSTRTQESSDNVKKDNAGAPSNKPYKKKNKAVIMEDEQMIEMQHESVRQIPQPHPPPPPPAGGSRRKWGSTGLAPSPSISMKRIPSGGDNDTNRRGGGGREVPSIQE